VKSARKEEEEWGWLATDKQQTHGGSAALHPNFAPLHCAKLRHASTVEQSRCAAALPLALQR